MVKEIETERLILRELQLSDVTGMFELDSDPEVLKFIGIDTVKSEEESEGIIKMLQKQYRENGIGRWAVINKETNEFMGWSGLKLHKDPINGYVDVYELGYRFIKKFWGKGYATETSRAWVDYGFEELKADTIYAMTEQEHHASIHVLEKVGFTNVEIFNYLDEELFWFELNRKL